MYSVLMRFATINGLPGVIVDGPEGAVQTAAFEIDGDVIHALFVVRNPDKLRLGGGIAA
jgi:RNA polymerase sigma-70 factor, ECF subfamily